MVSFGTHLKNMDCFCASSVSDVNVNIWFCRLKDKMGPPSNEEKIYGYIDLFKQVGDARPAHVYSLCTKEVKIGREHKCDIRIHNLRISRLQCCVNVTGPEDNQKVSAKPNCISVGEPSRASKFV